MSDEWKEQFDKDQRALDVDEVVEPEETEEVSSEEEISADVETDESSETSEVEEELSHGEKTALGRKWKKELDEQKADFLAREEKLNDEIRRQAEGQAELRGQLEAMARQTPEMAVPELDPEDVVTAGQLQNILDRQREADRKASEDAVKAEQDMVRNYRDEYRRTLEGMSSDPHYDEIKAILEADAEFDAIHNITDPVGDFHRNYYGAKSKLLEDKVDSANKLRGEQPIGTGVGGKGKSAPKPEQPLPEVKDPYAKNFLEHVKREGGDPDALRKKAQEG